MLKVTLSSNNQIEIDWKHNIPTTGDKLDNSNVEDVEGSTECFIKQGNKLLHTDKAVLSKGDNYCKETGRKISLKRTIKKFFSKNDRTAIWNTYLNRKQVTV
jgi:hypothetical protein